MVSHRFSLVILLVSGLLFSACKTSKTPASTQNKDQTVVGTVGGESVTFQELRQNYQSSSPIKNVGQDDLSDFLPVYLNYRAKLKEARKAGYYDNPSIIEEYNNYAEQAAYSYWMERVVLDSLMDDFHERNQHEIKAAHILRRLTGQATPSDTAEAYNKLMQARQEYLQGAPFDSLIQQYSTKQRGRPLGGEVGYFTAGNTIKAFEDAAFHLPVDSISMPIRSQYGYHLLKVIDKRERKRDRQVSHIFFSVQSKSQLDSARIKAQEAYDALESGMEWKEAVQQYTEDRASRRKGGQIGWINYGRRLDPAFVDSVMAVDTVGTHTNPIRSKYGYHILRIDSVRTFESEKAEREHLMSKMKKLPRYKNRKQIVHNEVANVGNAQTFKEPLSVLVDEVTQHDTVQINSISISDSLAANTAYRINNQDYKVGAFINWVKEKHGQTPANRFRASWFDDFKLNAISEHLVELTKKRFPEFKNKIKNYMDGLVVFQITQDSVWNYAETDTARLKEIYKAHPDSFRYDKRYHYYLFAGRQDSLLKEATRRFQDGMHPDSVDNDMQGVAIRTDSSSYVDEFPFSKLKEMETGSFSNLVKYRDQKAYLYLEEILQPRRMRFDEAYNRLVSYYQPIREKEWTQALKDRYNIKMYHDRLEKKLANTNK